ncbi:ABC transporter ATP-binding protein [Phreatobacter stygius]|uniref:ABC transporter ATP-binding protein n=1 Tax=Phreatobacter stygius TaxID=1940610 RepID=A0A4D7AX65_9HYPH|nr:ABC transporter ATP-binding protein [Phreatobacter stygius]QCI66194.1 ABC transporter ATP-binding protein [Phreatobacter stygius]
MSGLVLENVGVRLGRKAVVEAVSLVVPAGTFLAIVGPNGVGKTSLLKAIAGLTRSDGVIRLGGTDLARLPAEARARRLAYLPQRAEVAWALPVRDAVALGRLPHGDPFGRPTAADAQAVARALDRLDLGAFADRPVTALSGGERARVMLARVLATETQVILADEPTAALDPAQQLGVLELLRAVGVAGGIVVAVLHDLTLAARFADRIVVMDAGRIVADGPPATVLTDRLLADVFRLRCAITEIDGRRVPVPVGRIPG